MRSRILYASFLATLVLGCAGQVSHPNETLSIYLARHGRTDWNAERRLQGWSDRHLDATGREQAERLATRLAGVKLDRVYSSTLARSRETAEIARGKTPLESRDDLREQRLGRFEGIRLGVDTLAVAEFERRSRDPDDALDGGESDNQFFARVRTAIAAIIAKHPTGNILIVGHGGTNQMILRALLDLAPAQADSIRQANDELYRIDIGPGGPPHLWKEIPKTRLQEL